MREKQPAEGGLRTEHLMTRQMEQGKRKGEAVERKRGWATGHMGTRVAWRCVDSGNPGNPGNPRNPRNPRNPGKIPCGFREEVVGG